MSKFLPASITAEEAEAQREAYNAAFEDLGLNWRWDPDTFERVRAMGRDAVHQYLTREHPYLLRAYDVDFLARAIETAKARYYTSTAAID